jgi:hypothetical protein
MGRVDVFKVLSEDCRGGLVCMRRSKKTYRFPFIMDRKTMLLLVLLAMPFAAAQTYSDIDPSLLPVTYVYDTIDRENRLITDYSYERLDMLLGDARFRSWNHVSRVCESMEIMFGYTSPRCGPATQLFVPRQVTDRAYVSFEILPPPVLPAPRLVVLVDPMYPPWPPAGPWW